MAGFYEKIIGCRNEGIYRVVTLFGIKFRYKNARVQTLAETKKLSAQCTNLADSIRTLSEFSRRHHETINAILTKKLGELNSQLASLNDVSGRDHRATAQKLDEANKLLRSYTATLAEFRVMQEEVNKLQGQNHKETAQKLDEATKLMRTDVGRTGSLLELKYDFARYYRNPFERGFLLPMFAYMERPDFEEKYLALVHGMAPSSVREVNKILSRVSMVKTKPDQARHNFYSVSEQVERTRLRTDFENQILRISDKLFAYDRYLLPIRHFEICVFLYKHGIKLVRDKESIRKKDMIDAGGFIGDSALVLSDYTDKRIFSFEANPQNFDLLKKTLEINHLSKVVPVQKALWNSETELEMHAQGSCSSLTEVGNIKYVDGTVKVPTVTLDNFVRENKIDVGLIKVDLEGAELEFLQGAEHTIRTQKPVLLLSIYHKPSDFFELKPMLEQWVPEYEFTVFNPVDWGILLETMIVAQPRLSLSQKS